MLFLAAGALVCGLVRLAAPHVRSIAAARECLKPGMSYVSVGQRFVPIDGVWTPEELSKLTAAFLNGGDFEEALAMGRERVEALIRGGCPVCSNKDCKKLFPGEVPEKCDRCGHEVNNPEG